MGLPLRQLACLLLVSACGNGDGTVDSSPDTTTTTTTETDDLDPPAFRLCDDDGPSTIADASYATHVAPIFDESCRSCHASTNAPIQFDNAYAELIDVPSKGLPSMNRVTAGSLDTSYLWHKLCDTHRNVDGLGVSMPKNDKLTRDQMETVRSWIIDGAAP